MARQGSREAIRIDTGRALFPPGEKVGQAFKPDPLLPFVRLEGLTYRPSPSAGSFRSFSLPPHGRFLLRSLAACLLCSLVTAGLCGCVERRMTIRTNVDAEGGALAIVDHQEVGVTPVSTGFTYYADREVRLIKDGYETVTLVQPIPAPWWDSLWVEFFVENLWPFTLRDEREFHYEMQPTVSVSKEELLRRGQELRTEGHLGPGVMPASRPSRLNPQLDF